jgi:hypothetical protein
MMPFLLTLMVLILGIYTLSKNLAGNYANTIECGNSLYCQFIVIGSSENRTF